MGTRLKNGSFVTGGYVVRKGQKGIKYKKDVGKTVLYTILNGAIATIPTAIYLNSLKKKMDEQKQQKENGGKE